MSAEFSFNIDRAVVESAASAKSTRSPSILPEQGKSTAGQLETQPLIEMRYQQHLAQQGLQELFESGELDFS
jgi:hypothetical protein